VRKILTHPLTSVVILTAAVLLCFGRTLNSYFLADDFGEVAYVSKIFEGDLKRLWSNFTGNYMQVPSMAVYRPWLLMTLFFDYAVWKTNAFGFYLTNILHYLACTVLIFAIVRLLTDYWGKVRSTLAAVFSGLLFAVNPLHCESVSWVVGRVDVVCLTYYLLGLLSVALYTRKQNKKWLILTFASFWLGILTKEMAIALPVTATLLAFLFSKPKGTDEKTQSIRGSKPGSSDSPQPGFNPSAGTTDSYEVSRATAVAALQKLNAAANPIETTEAVPTGMTFVDRIKAAVPVGAMLFVCTVVYFIIRYASLGTITGGYTGSIGSSQLSGIVQKWTDVDTVVRLMFPLNQFVFGDETLSRNILASIYFVLLALCAARLLIGATPRRWLLFIFAAVATSLAPIYQLWGLGYNLEGSRFVFFLTVPLAMLFPIVLFAPLKRGTVETESVEEDKSRFGTGTKIACLSAIALTALTVFDARLTLRNNIPWVHAGKQTEAITTKARDLSVSTKQGDLVCVVGIPKDEGGAHMILNGTTFRHLITPPFSQEGLTGKILTFEPVLFGNPEALDTGHFKEALRQPNVKAFYAWNMEKKDFVPFTPGTRPAQPQTFKVPLATGSPSESVAGIGSSLPGAIAAFPYTANRGDVDASGKIKDAHAGLGIRISGLKLMPAQFDYAVIKANIPATSGFNSKTCKVTLQSSNRKKAEFDAAFSTSGDEIRVPLSSYWRFFAAGEIAVLEIELPPIAELTVQSVELAPAELIAPTLTGKGLRTSNEGSLVVDRRASSKERIQGDVQLSVDASALKGATEVELQVLRQNFFFDNLTSEAAQESGTQLKLFSAAGLPTITIPLQIVEKSGYVQMRARCLNRAKQQVGEYSYPVTLRVLND